MTSADHPTLTPSATVRNKPAAPAAPHRQGAQSPTPSPAARPAAASNSFSKAAVNTRMNTAAAPRRTCCADGHGRGSRLWRRQFSDPQPQTVSAIVILQLFSNFRLITIKIKKKVQLLLELLPKNFPGCFLMDSDGLISYFLLLNSVKIPGEAGPRLGTHSSWTQERQFSLLFLIDI